MQKDDIQLREKLKNLNTIFVHQKHEIAELIGYETRNKYEILDEHGKPLGFAAEQHKGIFAFLTRQFLGHWRTFEIFIFDQNREIVFKCLHPFRFIFNRFEVYNVTGEPLGVLQQRFSIFSRRFDVLDRRQNIIFQMVSPLIRFWTFKFLRRGSEVARIEKKWSGLLSEGFTDKDNFRLSIKDPNLDSDTRILLMASCLFVDLMYFERKARN